MKCYLNSAAKLIERETLHIRTDIYRLVQIEIRKSAEDIYSGIAEFQISLDHGHSQSDDVIVNVQESYDNDRPNNRKARRAGTNQSLRSALKW